MQLLSYTDYPIPLLTRQLLDFSKSGFSLAFKRHLLKHEAARQSPALGHLLVSSNHAALKTSLREELGKKKSNPQQTKWCFTSL